MPFDVLVFMRCGQFEKILGGSLSATTDRHSDWWNAHRFLESGKTKHVVVNGAKQCMQSERLRHVRVANCRQVRRDDREDVPNRTLDLSRLRKASLLVVPAVKSFQLGVARTDNAFFHRQDQVGNK